MAKAYTVAEIEEMRSLARRLIEGPTLNWTVNSDMSMCSIGYSYMESERAAAVEDRVRTYIMAGIAVEELRVAVAEMDARSDAAKERALAAYDAARAKPNI